MSPHPPTGGTCRPQPGTRPGAIRRAGGGRFANRVSLGNPDVVGSTSGSSGRDLSCPGFRVHTVWPGHTERWGYLGFSSMHRPSVPGEHRRCRLNERARRGVARRTRASRSTLCCLGIRRGGGKHPNRVFRGRHRLCQCQRSGMPRTGPSPPGDPGSQQRSLGKRKGAGFIPCPDREMGSLRAARVGVIVAQRG